MSYRLVIRFLEKHSQSNKDPVKVFVVYANRMYSVYVCNRSITRSSTFAFRRARHAAAFVRHLFDSAELEHTTFAIKQDVFAPAFEEEEEEEGAVRGDTVGKMLTEFNRLMSETRHSSSQLVTYIEHNMSVESCLETIKLAKYAV